MYHKILIGGVTAAAILGAGGTALAVTGSDATSGTPDANQTARISSSPRSHARHGLLRRLQHGQIVTRGKDGTFVTHDVIKGTVTAVSPTSITVQAADKTGETFAVTKDTKVRIRTDGKGSASSITAVHEGDRVLVAGTGTSHFTANRVVDRRK